VDVHAGAAQNSGIDRLDTGTAECLALFHEAAQRLVRGVERAAQFVLHPGDGAQVVAGFGRVRCGA
jgi:hypothetical protein